MNPLQVAPMGTETIPTTPSSRGLYLATEDRNFLSPTGSVQDVADRLKTGMAWWLGLSDGDRGLLKAGREELDALRREPSQPA